MRYWGTDKKVARSRRQRVSRTREPRQQPRPDTEPDKPSVLNGGSARPFLRRIYQHQAVVGGPVQRLFLFLVIAGIIYAFVLGEAGAIRIAVLRHDRNELDKTIAELRSNAARLQAEIATLESDPFYLEKVGREKLSYVRPDEHVYKIVPPETSK